MHFNMPCSNARDMPKVLFPVPGHPVMIISFGGSFPSLSGGGALNVRRCLTPADKAVRVRMVGTGWKADAVDKIAKPNNNKISKGI